jgi:ABC-type dipeptide/oligopeptide/nickel transport system ATPase component
MNLPQQGSIVEQQRKCNIIENPVHTYSTTLKCRRSSQYDHDDDSAGGGPLG